MTNAGREIQYLVLPNSQEPFLLARVRWPDVFQAISPGRPDWQDDPGLFDLPYAAASTAVTGAEAAQIAAAWGARIPSGEEAQTLGPSLIRRMPSDWSNLSTAERRAWSITAGKSPARPAPVPTTPAVDPAPGRALPTSAPASRRRRWVRRRAVPALVEGSGPPDNPILDGLHVPSRVSDLTEPRGAADAMADYA